jgi:RimJ/RimL family protein N-acetyltransferase
MMRRTLDPAFLNAVANDPEVRPWIGGTGALDLGPLIADPANIALESAHGGWVLIRHEPGIYELHTLFRRAGRGRVYFEAATAALDYVFAGTDAREIVTRVPANNPHADLAAARCGFSERFTRRDAFTDPDGRAWDVSYQGLDIDGWMMRSETALAEGRAFHEVIEGARGQSSHPDDEAHDRAAGAAALMIRAGNPRKGVWIYNRWARLAGYAPIALISEAPLAIDVVDAVIGIRAGEMEILLCR